MIESEDVIVTTNEVEAVAVGELFIDPVSVIVYAPAAQEELIVI